MLAALARESRLRPNEIGIIVQDGIVTLTGWTNSYTKRFLARAVTLRVSEVKAVADEIQVRLPGDSRRTDADRAAAVRLALEADAAIPIERIAITVSEGLVILDGAVDRQSQIEEVERVVLGVEGVQGVVTHLSVRPLHPSPA